MDRPNNTRLVFEDQLKTEAQRVLEGPVFRRSPVQSQLLRYLLERTLEGGPPPSQYEVAVDGLGKDADFDLASDSYPRVQISRLRSNLDSYYSRQAPGNGLRLMIEAGEYKLGLEKIAPAPPPPPSPIASVSTRFEADTRPATPVTGTSDPAPLPAPASAPSSAPSSPPSSATPEPKTTNNRMVFALLGAIAVLLAALAYSNLSRSPADPITSIIAGGPVEKPRIRLVVDSKALPVDDQQTLDRVQVASRMVEVQLAYSWVSIPTIAEDEADSDYTLTLDFARSANRPLRTFVGLSDPSGKVLFRDRVIENPQSPGLFPQELAAAIVYITSPTGVIAADRLALTQQEPRNGYECFLKIENSRADGRRTASLVDACIEEFADSEFSPFFLARRAFTGFQRRIMEDKPIERTGPAWEDLQSALDQDRFNAFANFTAAKVELANGNCAGASDYVRNAFERAISYPAMIVAIEAAATSCPALQTKNGADIEAIVRANPSPDPLLYLYLLIGLIGDDKMDEVRELSQRLPVRDPSGIELQTIALLQRSIADPAYAKANAARLRKDVGLFVWGDAGVEKVIAALTDPAPVETDEIGNAGEVATPSG